MFQCGSVLHESRVQVCAGCLRHSLCVSTNTRAWLLAVRQWVYSTFMMPRTPLCTYSRTMRRCFEADQCQTPRPGANLCRANGPTSHAPCEPQVAKTIFWNTLILQCPILLFPSSADRPLPESQVAKPPNGRGCHPGILWPSPSNIQTYAGTP